MGRGGTRTRLAGRTTAAAERGAWQCRQGVAVAVTNSCKAVFEDGELHIRRTGWLHSRRTVHPRTSITVRLAPAWNSNRRAPPHCLARRRILTHARHYARLDSPQAAEHRLSSFFLSNCNTHQRCAAHVWSCDMLPRSVHSLCELWRPPLWPARLNQQLILTMSHGIWHGRRNTQ